MSETEYKVKLGVMSFGGCGNTVALQIMNQFDPVKYPNLHIFAGNTDAKVLKRYFGNKEEQKLKPWFEGGTFTEEQLGRHEVTQGNGAGGDPAIGRKASEFPESLEAMRTWLEGVDEVFLTGGLGGGTGSGALPVAARLCKEMGKSALALVVMPEPEEGLEKYAVPALEEIRSLVTTAPIYNSKLMVYLESLPEAERNSLTTQQSRAIINEKSLLRILKILREVIQETGEEEFDLADYRMTKGRGKHFYFDTATIEIKDRATVTAESVADSLTKGEFIDKGVAERGEILSFWFHGPWPHVLKQGVRNVLRARLLEKRPELAGDLEVHWGLFEETNDNEMWVAVMITANDEPTMTASKEVRVLTETWKGPSVPAQRSEPEGHIVISFKVDGQTVHKRVPTKLALRFNRIDELFMPIEEIKAIYAEIRNVTGVEPDLSDWHREVPGSASSVGNH